MLLWLAEAAGVENALLNAAKEDASKLPKLASQSAAIRKHIPWQTIVNALGPEWQFDFKAGFQTQIEHQNGG